MLKLLVYTDGEPGANRALHFAAELKKHLRAELAVITVRSGTNAFEAPPPIGVEYLFENRRDLPIGLQQLAEAAARLAEEGLIQNPQTISINDTPHGYLFVCKTPAGERIPFYECFGHFVDVLNKEVERHNYHLLIIAPSRETWPGKIVTGDTTRKLALNLHASILVVRGGRPDDRYLICADGSPSSRRVFPLLRLLLPAIQKPVDLVCVQKPETATRTQQDAAECIQNASDWLMRCGKKGAIQVRQAASRLELILDMAGAHSVIVMGASMRHELYRRMLGSLPMRILARTDASVLLVKQLPEADTDFMKDPFSCG